MSKKMDEHKNEIFRTLRSSGWKQDNWGHYKKETKSGNLLRIKVQAKSLRLEKRVKICGKNEWHRVSSDFFGKCRVEGESVVIGGVRILNRG